jgi:hypothetical protein
MSNSAPLPGSVSNHGGRNQGLPQPNQKTTPSGLELVSEVSDLAAGLGLLIFTLTPLALPALALTALAAALLLIPALVAATLVAPFVLARRWRRRRSPPHSMRASKRSPVSSPVPALPAPAMSPARSSSPTADAPRPLIERGRAA